MTFQQQLGVTGVDFVGGTHLVGLSGLLNFFNLTPVATDVVTLETAILVQIKQALEPFDIDVVPVDYGTANGVFPARGLAKRDRADIGPITPVYRPSLVAMMFTCSSRVFSLK